MMKLDPLKAKLCVVLLSHKTLELRRRPHQSEKDGRLCMTHFRFDISSWHLLTSKWL